MAKKPPLSPVTRTPLYEQLVDRLREYVREEGLKAGDRLPAERVLAQDLGVSRPTVRQALVVLEVQGLIDVRHGGGTYLRQDNLEPSTFAQVLDRQRRLPDILDAREALEVKLAELAAERRTPEDLAAIQAGLEEMAASIGEGGSGADGDASFHAAVTAAAHSSLLEHLMHQLSADITVSRIESLAQEGRPPQSLAQHRSIADAIAAGDAGGARDAMRRHLRSVGDVKLLKWDPDSAGSR